MGWAVFIAVILAMALLLVHAGRRAEAAKAEEEMMEALLEAFEREREARREAAKMSDSELDDSLSR